MRILVFIIVLFGSISCKKDPILSEVAETQNLASTLLNIEGVIIDTIFAHAGNHPNFEKETDQFDIHLRFPLHTQAGNIRVYRNDSITEQDSLNLYKLIEPATTPEPQGIFSNLLFKSIEEKRDFFIRVLYRANDTAFLTRSVRIRANNDITDTKNVRDISVETTPGGRAYFDWVGASIASQENLIELKDATGKTFCAVVTKDPDFLFHNLRNVSIDFTPELFAPRLVEKQNYSAHIYMNDNAGWMRNYRTFSFTADSNNIHTIE